MRPFKKGIRYRLARKALSSPRLYNFPGFEGVSAYHVAYYFYRGLSRGAVTTRASALAFNFFLALFPAIIFLFTLIPYVPIKGFQDELLGIIADVTPKGVHNAIQSTIEDIVKKQRSGLLSFGFLTALYFASNGINAMFAAFNRSYHVVSSRSPISQRLLSAALTIALSVILVVAIVLMAFSELTLDYLIKLGLLKDWILYYILLLGRWLIIGGLFYFVISTLYFYGSRSKSRWKFFSPGSTMATTLSILASLAFGFYVNNFGQYNKLYGSIGTLIIILLWLYFNSLILLLGFEMNASINFLKHRRKKPLESLKNAR